MSSLPHGKNTSVVEITNISAHGIWLLAHDEELFLSYEDFPWFKDQPVKAIFNVQEPVPDHYYWPDLDIDIGKVTIKNPEKYPLKSS